MDEYVMVTYINNMEIDTNHYLFNLKEYLRDINRSYNHTWDRIWYQFLIDFPRTNIYWNGVKMSNPCDFFVQCEQNRTSILLCTQAAFFLPFELMSKIYNRQSLDIVVVDSKHVRSSVHVVDGGVKLFQQFLLKDCENDIVLSYINIEMDMSFDEEYGVLTWKIGSSYLQMKVEDV